MNRLEQLSEDVYFDSSRGTFINRPQIIVFRPSKDVLTDSQPAIVTWEVEGADTITLNDEIVSASGSKPFYTDCILNICLTAEKLGIPPLKQGFTIRAERALPVIEFFTVNTDFVVKGMPVSLSWNITGAARVEIDNGIGSVTGRNSIDIIIGQSGVFNLIAYNHFGDKSFASTSVTVFPTPLIQGVFCATPGIIIKPIEIKQLCFTSAVIVSGNIAPYAPPLTKPVSFEKKLILNKILVDFALFHGNKHSFSFNNHNNIITHIKLLWKRLFRAGTMENLPQN
jgi:hypothetical protein